MEELYIYQKTDTENTKKMLSEFMGMIPEQFEIFCSLMERTDSIISGGFLLRSLFEFNDNISESIYIYCTYNGALEINNFLKDEKIVRAEEQNVKITDPNNNPSEPEAFFFKNRINVRLEYFIASGNGSRSSKIKIYIVEKSEDILKAVNNFDLSFTHIWFDGTNLKTTYKEDIETRAGYINSEYTEFILHFNPIMIERVQKYKRRGFEISYVSPSLNVIVHNNKPMYDSSNKDKILVNFLYTHLIKQMVTMAEKYNEQTVNYKEILGKADIYLTHFWLEKYTLQQFLNLLSELEMKKCLLPFWIQYTYAIEEEEQKKRDKKILIERLRAQLPPIIKTYKPLSEDDKHKTEIVKMLLFKVCLLGQFALAASTNLDLYKKRAREFILEKYGIDRSGIREILKKYDDAKGIYFSYQYKPYKIRIYENAKMLCLKKYEVIRFQKVKKDIRKQTNSREIKWLNIVDPVVTKPINFNEKELVSYHSQEPSVDMDEDGEKVFTNSRGCLSIHNFGIYNINAFLNGEAVEGYNINGNFRDKSIDLLEEDARERIVFFLAKSTDLTDLTPYCYTLSDLANDVGHRLYLNCENGKKTTKEKLFEQIDNLIIKLSLGDHQIYVPLGEIIYAIYKTQKQSFILIPTDKVFNHTASLSYIYPHFNIRSIDHCQDESNKEIHTIRVCQGDGKDDHCWPINERLEKVEYTKDTFYLDQKYYVDDILIEKLDNEQNFLEESLHHNIIVKNMEDEMSEILSYMIDLQKDNFLYLFTDRLLFMRDYDREQLALSYMDLNQKIRYKTYKLFNFITEDKPTKESFLRKWSRYYNYNQMDYILDEFQEMSEETRNEKMREFYNYINSKDDLELERDLAYADTDED
jgi:hypothetical protein